MPKEEVILETIESIKKLKFFEYEAHKDKQWQLGFTEIKTLDFISRFEEGESSGEIAAFLDVSTARVAKILSGLEKNGLLERRIDPFDRRKIIVKLTENGKKKYETINKIMFGHMNEMYEALGPEDAESFSRIVKKLCGWVEENKSVLVEKMRKAEQNN